MDLDVNKPVLDVNNQVIKLYDVCKNVDTQEIVLVTEAENTKFHLKGLCVTNEIAGIDDWLTVYPDGAFEILGNAATSY